MTRVRTVCPGPWAPRLGAAALALALASGAGGESGAPGAGAIEQWRLGGDTVYLLEDRRAPLVSVRIEFPVGAWSSWAFEHHAADAFAIQTHDPGRRLLGRADALAVELEAGMTPTHARMRATCLAEDTADVLALLRDVLAGRDFDTAELKRWHQQRSLAWDANRKDPDFTLSRTGVRLLTAEGDPRRRAWEEPPDGDTRAERLIATRDAVVRAPNRTIAVAGGIGRAELEPLLADLLPPSGTFPDGVAPAAGDVTLAPLTARPARPGAFTVTLPRLTQVYLALVRDGMAVDHADYPAFRIADHVLAGHFYSRMYVALRHEGGETYNISSRSHGAAHRPRVYTLRTSTRTANAGRTERIFADTLEAFHRGGISDRERRDAAGNIAGRRLFQRQTPTQVLGERLTERRLGFADGFYASLDARASALTLAEVNAFIRRFYDPAGFTLVRLAAEE